MEGHTAPQCMSPIKIRALVGIYIVFLTQRFQFGASYLQYHGVCVIISDNVVYNKLPFFLSVFILSDSTHSKPIPGIAYSLPSRLFVPPHTTSQSPYICTYSVHLSGYVQC